MKKPYWIRVGFTPETHIFEGHQLHWANCFFSNATYAEIKYSLENNTLFSVQVDEWEIREMTDEELIQYPEAVEFQHQLMIEYGEF